MKENIVKGSLLGWVALHLALVCLGASYSKLPDWLPGKSLFDFYAHASGASSSFGFFAPSIGMKVRVLFDIVKKDGTKIANVPLIPEADRETYIRLAGVFGEFTSEADDARFRQTLAASLAAAAFTKYRDASEVVLHVQEFSPTTMAEYREGKRATWSEYYTARFAGPKNKKETHNDYDS